MIKSGIFFLFILVSLLFASCGNSDRDYIDPRGTDYAGAASCVQCHKAAYESHLKTSHFKATAPASAANLLGNFSPGHNEFEYDPHTKLVMEKRGDSLCQVLYKDGKEVHAFAFDIVFGATHAQTSVYWHDNNTFELPVSYYKSLDDWATSPHFSSTVPNFSRKVTKDCFACHSSNASSRVVTASSANNNTLSMDMEDVIDKKTIVYGIDCERCHGPAKKHVDHHLKFPDEKTPHDMVSFKSMDNQQKLDACSVCHSGDGSGFKIKSRFQFRPGDRLSEFYRSPIGDNEIDVHGNQNGLLAKSKCFTQSQTMNCITCHNAHENASTDLAAYSKVCLSCHNLVSHSTNTTKILPESLLKQNCIDCHMPKQTSKAISFQRAKSAEFSSYTLRTHTIAVYPAKK